LEPHSAIVYFSAHFAVIQPQATTVLVILLLLFMVLSFAVSGAEAAFFSLTFKDVNLLKTKPQASYKRIVALLEEPKVLLAALLIAGNVFNITIIVLLNILMDGYLQINEVWLTFVIKVIVIIFLLVLFCDIMPKVYAGQNNIRFAKDFGILIEAVYYLFSRMGRWMVKYTGFIEKKMGKKEGAYAFEELETDKESSEEEKNILKGIVKFGNIMVKQIMKTRLDVCGIEYNTTFDAVIKKIEELHYSRLPVYKEDLDKMVGLLHTKDVLPYIHESSNFDWHTLIRPPYFVHEQKMIDDLLKEFQQRHIHFAIVVDEFGGTSGIVTLEDILEEIIGDISDEFDEEEARFKKIDDNTYIFDGGMMINDVCRLMNLPLDTFDQVKGESDSLGGLVLEISGEIPSVNEVIVVGDFEFTVIEKEKNRLRKIKITIKPQVE
jgi:gliding motility-associated protein GldE